MQTAPLGRSGLRVSRVGLGTWRSWGTALDYAGAERCLRVALERGVNLVDVADVYAGGQAESWLGWMLDSLNRSSLVVTTKVFWPSGDGPNDRGLSAKHVREALDGSLARLRTDYVDLYLCHRFDAGVPLSETVSAMGREIAAGRVRYWGVSGWHAAQIVDACRTADALGVPRPVCNQPPYSLLDRRIEAEILPVSRDLGVDQVVFSPLAQGVLSGKYLDSPPPEGSRAADPDRVGGMQRHLAREAAVRRVVEIAADLGTTPARLAIAWTLQRPGVASTLFGATRPEHVADNVEAASLEIPAGVRSMLDTIQL